MDRVQLSELIGVGHKGKVYRAQFRAGPGAAEETIVVKELDYRDISTYRKQQIVSEVNLLRECRNGNIVRYIDRVVDKENQKLFILMEHCPGGDLGSFLQKREKRKEPLSEEYIWRVFKQLTLALYEIHRRKDGKTILHRDIKPSNIFLDQDLSVKLGDFGVAKQMEQEDTLAQTQNVVQQTYYKSPEQILRGTYSEKSEIYCIGHLLYDMACVADRTQRENYARFFQEGPRFKPQGRKISLAYRYSPELQRVINWCLQQDESHRPSVDDLLNLPNISMQLRENRLRENTAILTKREEETSKKLLDLGIKEKQIADALVLVEEQIAGLENQVSLLDKPVLHSPKQRTLPKRISSHNSLYSEVQSNGPVNLPAYGNMLQKAFKPSLKLNEQPNKKQLLTIHKTTTNIQNNNFITYNFNSNTTTSNSQRPQKALYDSNKKFLFQS